MLEMNETICALDDDASVRCSTEHLLDSDGLSAETLIALVHQALRPGASDGPNLP